MKTRYESIAVADSVNLVPRSSADAAELFEIVDRDRRDLRTWLGWVDATQSVGDVRRYSYFIERQFEQRAGFDYGIRLNRAFVGSAGLHNIDWSVRSAHIGYWLRPSARGGGVMTQCVRALSTYAFESLGFHRLEIRCVVDNTASRAVAERLNYRLEGILKDGYILHGRLRDLALYAITGPEWLERQR